MCDRGRWARSSRRPGICFPSIPSLTSAREAAQPWVRGLRGGLVVILSHGSLPTGTLDDAVQRHRRLDVAGERAGDRWGEALSVSAGSCGSPCRARGSSWAPRATASSWCSPRRTEAAAGGGGGAARPGTRTSGRAGSREGPDGDAHRRAAAARGRLHRPGRAPGGADRRDRRGGQIVVSEATRAVLRTSPSGIWD